MRAVKPELRRAPRRPLVVVPPSPKAQTILLDRLRPPLDRYRQRALGHDPVARIQALRSIGSRFLSIRATCTCPIRAAGATASNMAFRYGGERLLTQVVRETLVKIDRFVEVDFRGFQNLVGKLGGVYVPVDQRYFNHNVGTAGTDYADIDLQPGYQKLNGEQALAFVRYRHTDNDFVRAARQQLLLRIVARDALADEWNLLRVRRLALAAAKATTSDISSLSQIYSLGKAVYDTPGSRIVRLTVTAGDLHLYGADYLSATPSQLRATVRSWLGASRPRRAAAASRAASTPPAPAGSRRTEAAAARCSRPWATASAPARRPHCPEASGRRAQQPARTRSRAILRSPCRRPQAGRLGALDVHDLGRPADPARPDVNDHPRRPSLRRLHGRRQDPRGRLAHRGDPRVDHEYARGHGLERRDARARGGVPLDARAQAKGRSRRRRTAAICRLTGSSGRRVSPDSVGPAASVRVQPSLQPVPQDPHPSAASVVRRSGSCP